MKILTLLFVLLCWACAKSVDYDSEKAAITKLIDDETNYAAAADSVNWAKCWANTSEAQFTITAVGGAQQYTGWSNVENAVHGFMRSMKPLELKLKRDNFNFTIGHDVAFVSFDQHDNWDDSAERKTKESRTLKKIGGEWKIVNVNVIGVSSFQNVKTGSYHVAKENIPVGMKASKTVMHSQTGLGGMAVAYNEIPAGGDMSPLFEGLPDNACPAAHWGYLLEGTLRLKYVDGKEETVKAGEVFYWPAGHVPFVEKDIKIIDFTPEAEFNQLMTHIATKMEASKAK